MNFNTKLSRRKFLNTNVAALSYFFIAGTGRVKADPSDIAITDDYTGCGRSRHSRCQSYCEYSKFEQ